MSSNYAALKQRVRELREAERVSREAGEGSGSYVLAEEARAAAGSSREHATGGGECSGSGRSAGGRAAGGRPLTSHDKDGQGKGKPGSIQELFASQRKHIGELESRCASLEERLNEAVSRHARQRSLHEKEKAAWARKQASAAKQAESADAAAMAMVADARSAAEKEIAMVEEKWQRRQREWEESVLERDESHNFELNELRSRLQAAEEGMGAEKFSLEARIEALNASLDRSSAENAALADKLEALAAVAQERADQAVSLRSRIESVTLASRHASSKQESEITAMQNEHREELAEQRLAHEAELDRIMEKVKGILRKKDEEISELREDLSSARQCIRDTESLLE